MWCERGSGVVEGVCYVEEVAFLSADDVMSTSRELQ